MSWKQAILASTLALGAHSGLQAKPLPCPTSGPLNDTAHVVREDVARKINERLRAIDTQKRHQLVVVTVANLEEYGATTPEELARNIGNECKVGYRGEDTGIVVLYTQKPAYYFIATAKTERYVRDIEARRLISDSKESCPKQDVSCRLDYMTRGLDRLIEKGLKEWGKNQGDVGTPTSSGVTEGVNHIDAAKQEYDKKKRAESLSAFMNTLGVGGTFIIITGGVGYTIHRIRKNRRRSALRKEFFIFSKRFQEIKGAYPTWFQQKYISPYNSFISGLSKYTDEQIDALIEHKKTEFNGNSFSRKHSTTMQRLLTEIDGWSNLLQEIMEQIKSKSRELDVARETMETHAGNLKDAGFVFTYSQEGDINKSQEPDDVLDALNTALEKTKNTLSLLQGIPSYYARLADTDKRVLEDFAKVENLYSETFKKYSDTYGTTPPLVDMSKATQLKDEFIGIFRDAYKKKDIPRLRNIDKGGDAIVKNIMERVLYMEKKIEWYEALPEEIEKRRHQIESAHITPKHISDAQAYIKESGERKYVGYDPNDGIATLVALLSHIQTNHKQKIQLEKIDGELQNFDEEYSKFTGYIGLGVALIALREAARQAELERQRREEQRRRDEEDRRRREEEDARNTSVNSTSGWGGGGGGGGWSSGGGGGFDGGGAGGD